MKRYDWDPAKNYDFACGDYRYFQNYDETLEYWNKIKNDPSKRQYYGQYVLTFENITELQKTIYILQELARAVNEKTENRMIKKEFGDDGITHD